MALLEVRGLTKVFGGLTAVKNVSFDVEKGEIVSLIGPNGAGKTTTVSLITGLVRSTKGKVIFDGTDITGWDAYKISKYGLITTFQKTNVFPTITIEDAVMVGTHSKDKTTLFDILIRNKKYYAQLERCKRKVEEILEYTGLIEKKNILCMELSYGEQRILEIGIAMAAEPKLLILDEPATGLNQTESNNLMKMIYGLRDSGVTVLLIEHNMDLVMRISDRIVVLNFGEEVCFGTPQEVLCNKKVIEAYLGPEEDDAECC